MWRPPVEKRVLLIVDDIPINRLVLSNLFQDDYEVVEADNGRDALDIIHKLGEEIAVVLLDLVMPVMSGLEVLADMNETGIIKTLPVIVITSEDDDVKTLETYKHGVSDLIHKPFNAEIVCKRVENVAALYAYQRNLNQKLEEQRLMLQKQQARLKRSTQVVMDALATAVEFRGFESTEHIVKIRRVSWLLLQEIKDCYKLSDEQIELVANASAVHDIGKITIPDKILLKPARLTEEEFEVIKTHPLRGGEILKELSGLNDALDEEFLDYCYDICVYHHEKWDGKGYPYGLASEGIPIWAQVVSVADIYDALTAERVYKSAYSQDEAIRMIMAGDSGELNPKLLKALLSIKEKGLLES